MNLEATFGVDFVGWEAPAGLEGKLLGLATHTNLPPNYLQK